MRYFDFDKFSKSAWFGARHNRAWKRYGVPTTDDSAMYVVKEHNFLTPTTAWGQPYTERCICGWTGECWADHIEAEVNAAEPGEAPEQKPVQKRPRRLFFEPEVEEAPEEPPAEVAEEPEEEPEEPEPAVEVVVEAIDEEPAGEPEAAEEPEEAPEESE